MGRGHEGEPGKLQQGAMEKWRRHCSTRSCVGEAREVDGDGITLSRNPGRGAVCGDRGILVRRCYIHPGIGRLRMGIVEGLNTFEEYGKKSEEN